MKIPLPFPKKVIILFIYFVSVPQTQYNGLDNMFIIGILPKINATTAIRRVYVMLNERNRFVIGAIGEISSKL